jgi:hypothetical protein
MRSTREAPPFGEHARSTVTTIFTEAKVVCKRDGERSREALITQAYASLSSTAKGVHGESQISITTVGNYEIRMIGFVAYDRLTNGPFWLELFDHALGSAVDSCRCHTVQEGADRLGELIAQAHALSQ